MNSAEIVRLASEAGISVPLPADAVPESDQGLLRFAELVAAAEREACVRLCESILETHSRCADDNWEYYLPTEQEETLSRGAAECVAAIRQRQARPAARVPD